MKRFSAWIEANQLESAIDLPGWSHAEPEIDRPVLWYPWKSSFRRIHFTAPNRRTACQQLDKLGILARDLTDGQTIKATH